jgi:rSAM/selenodomain-associated transferase 2/rSAM/selenodomain-associated transferase 1
MPEEPLASVVIPVWRDEDALVTTLAFLPRRADVEVVVACALDEAARYEPARRLHPAVRWVAAPRGRACQMNAGAAIATGRWLVFLHADSRLPGDWADVVAEADRHSRTAAGGFTLALDSADWRARVIEAGARLRAALLGLPYGDQALFVRRRVFEAMGGYQDLPLMEDIDFVRRVRPWGRLHRSRSRVITSARRWERDGWFRRSAQNARLATQFLLGASPATLAQRYLGRRRQAVVMMARAPWLGGKTRLAADAGEAAHASLRHALFLDTLEVMTSIPDVSLVVACEPAEACEQMRDLAGHGTDVIAQRGRNLGERLTHVFEDVFRLGVESLVVIGSDLPDLPPRLIREALARIARGDRVVFGPAADGGYYLVGMSQPHAEVFDRIAWGTDRVLAQTLDAATAAALEVVLLDEWVDIDDDAHLEHLVHGTAGSGASRTRAWGAQHLVPPTAADYRNGLKAATRRDLPPPRAAIR